MTAVAGTARAADVSTDMMRAESDQIRAAVREDNRSLWERSRRAAQLAWEADLIDDAAMALAELQGARSGVPPLERAVRDAVAAERAAEDRLRADERHLARRRAEAKRAGDEYAPVERQEQLADRVRTSERVVAAGLTVVAAARQVRERAQAALAGREAHVAFLDGEHAEAARKAADPGPAPDLPGLAPGVGRVSDLDEDTRKLIALVAILGHGAQGSGGQAHQPRGNLGTTRGDLSRQDPGGFRFVRSGRGTAVLPPDWRGTGQGR